MLFKTEIKPSKKLASWYVLTDTINTSIQMIKNAIHNISELTISFRIGLPKSGPTYSGRAVNTRHETPQWHPVTKLIILLQMILVGNLNLKQGSSIATCPIHPDCKVHGDNMGPTWVLSAPDGPHVDTMNLVIRAEFSKKIFGQTYLYRSLCSANPLPELLTYHQRCSVAFTSEQFHKCACTQPVAWVQKFSF